MKAIKEHAIAKGLMGILPENLRLAKDAFKEARVELGKAFDDSGIVEEQAEKDKATNLMQRATLSLVELELLLLFDGGAEGAALAAEVRKQIRELRSEQPQEKQALHPALYKWGYNVIIGK